jgi:hypothetical protein
MTSGWADAEAALVGWFQLANCAALHLLRFLPDLEA